MSKLLELMQEDGLALRRAASTNGGEWHGQCPFCRRETGDGGDDRFVVTPGKGDCGAFWCRRNPHHGGDGIAYLRNHRGMGFREACAALGVARQRNGNGQRRHGDGWTPRPAATPPGAWRERARNLVEEAQENMFETDLGEAALAKLADTRFLTPETVENARLGLLPETRRPPKMEWEIPVRDGERPDIWIPPGLVIPGVHGGDVVSLTIRRRPEDDPRYVRITGSSSRCMWAGPEGGDARAVVVVESALDAILLHQELPDDIAAAALGSVSARPDADTARRLKELPLVLVALDGDESGASNAIGWWETNLQNAARLAYPKGRFAAKDPTELARAAGGTGILRDWVEAGIGIAESRRAEKRGPDGGGQRGERRAPPQAAKAARTAPEPVQRECEIEAGPPLDMRVTVVRDAAAAEKALARIGDFGGVAGLDTETTPLPRFANEKEAALDPYKSRARTLQVCTGDDVFVFDLNHVDIRALAPVAARPWAGHNSVFDIKVLKRAGVESATPDCTMLLANSIDNDGLPSLQDLASKRLGVELDKDARTGDWSGDLSAAQVEYAARDAWAASRLRERLAEQAERRDRTRLYNLMKDAQPVVAGMELAGIGFDSDAHAKLVGAWEGELEAAMADVRDAFGEGFNPNSPAQVNAWIRANLDPETLAAWPRTPSGLLSTTAEDVAIGADHPALGRVVAARALSHALSAFGEPLAALVNPATGRLHPHLMIAAQSTGRFSYAGPNMAGIPRDPRMRAVFVPGPGRAMVAADFSTVQIRIAALVSRDPRLTDATNRGQDLHRLTASLIMGKRPEEVSAEARNLSKPLNFGLLFCMSTSTLFRYAKSKFHVCMSVGDADRFREAYFRAYPGIRAWHDRVRGDLEDCGKVSTPCGRWCALDASLPAAAAHIIQGAEAEVMLASLGRLPDALRGIDATPVACIHDEIVLDVADADVADAKAAVRDAMEGGMRDVFPNAPVLGLVEAHHGPNWHAAK